MSNERDELVMDLAKIDGGHEIGSREFVYGPLADGLIAAGYRKPRTVTTVEAVQIWEDSVGDSGKPPTDEELAAFANAVLHEGSGS